MIYAEQFQWKNLHNTKAQARSKEALLHAIENELRLMFFTCFFFTFSLNDPSFLHCKVSREKVKPSKKTSANRNLLRI